MFGPNQSNVINICHGLQTFGAPKIQMSINICYNAKNGKRARNDIDKIQIETKVADNMQKVALDGPNCG
jgi:hypothetical protein